MILQNTGKIGDEMYVVGSAATPVYLFDGPAPAIFDAGLTAFANYYEKGIREVLKDRAPAYLFLTHSHFDHIGAASRFKQIWPDLQIGGSQKCGEILTKPNAIRLMQELTLESTRMAREMISKQMGGNDLYEQPFKPFELDLIVHSEQKIQLAPDLHVVPINTPGHTWDFMSYWIPERKILIASESVATYENLGYLQPEFLVDYDAYLESIKKIQNLGATILCAGHHAVFSGQDATDHIEGSFKAARDYLSMVEQILVEEKGDIDQAVAKVKQTEWDPRPWPKQPESAYVINTWQRVNTISKRMNLQ